MQPPEHWEKKAVRWDRALYVALLLAIMLGVHHLAVLLVH